MGVCVDAAQVFTIGPVDPAVNLKQFEVYCQRLSTLSRECVRCSPPCNPDGTPVIQGPAIRSVVLICS